MSSCSDSEDLPIPDGVCSDTEGLPIPDGACCSRAITILERRVWIIENFKLFRARRIKLKSPTFVSEKDDRLQWFLEIDPFHTHSNEFDCMMHSFVSVWLTTVPTHTTLELAGTTSQDKEPKSIRITCSIRNSKGKLCKTNNDVTSFLFSSETSVCYDLFYLLDNCDLDDDLDYNPNDPEGDLLPKDTLTIVYEIELLLDYENRIIASGSKEELECSLGSDMTSLLEGGADSNVTISAGEETFKAHKAILITRSPVFRAMFENNMTEATSNCIEISDMDPKVVKEMLKYIYTGNAPEVGKMADKLLQAADKYDLKQLKAMCERELTSRLTIENVADTCKLAHHHNATQLKAKCIGFMSIHAPHLVSKHIHLMDRAGEEDIASTSMCKKRKTQ